MQRKSENLLVPDFSQDLIPGLPRVLYGLILPNLSFKDLTLLAEADDFSLDHKVQKISESILMRNHPFYVNLKHAKQKNNYPVLINNLVKIISPFLFTLPSIRTKTAATYQRLCAEYGKLIGSIINSHLISTRVQNEIDLLLIHDFTFHYCQANPQEAGELLNDIILKPWNSGNRALCYYLIEYGANVNALSRYSRYSTLFHALTFNSSEQLIRLLLNHGAQYSGYSEIKHGIKYTLMLISALNRNWEALPVLMEKFPDEIAETLATLDLMFSRNNDREFTYESGAYKICDENEKILEKYYTVEEISQAKTMILQVISENSQTLQSSPPEPQANSRPRENFEPRSLLGPGQFSLFSRKESTAAATDNNHLRPSAER